MLSFLIGLVVLTGVGRVWFVLETLRAERESKRVCRALRRAQRLNPADHSYKIRYL